MKIDNQYIFLNTIMRMYEHASSIRQADILYVYIYKISQLSSMGHDNEPSLILDY